eukprot:TRINITY_DN24065_c0_g1_i1.p1 TRINITY_DN24065_c0_g1~~TRINITY_DN24065_c0_g1_i1.p1  ORF type:complete len:412 (+),score=30.05 TRINITY_DN24065_c0_g1_i1:66-1301(+)
MMLIIYAALCSLSVSGRDPRAPDFYYETVEVLKGEGYKAAAGWEDGEGWLAILNNTHVLGFEKENNGAKLSRTAKIDHGLSTCVVDGRIMVRTKNAVKIFSKTFDSKNATVHPMPTAKQDSILIHKKFHRQWFDLQPNIGVQLYSLPDGDNAPVSEAYISLPHATGGFWSQNKLFVYTRETGEIFILNGNLTEHRVLYQRGTKDIIGITPSPSQEHVIAVTQTSIITVDANTGAVFSENTEIFDIINHPVMFTSDGGASGAFVEVSQLLLLDLGNPPSYLHDIASYPIISLQGPPTSVVVTSVDFTVVTTTTGLYIFRTTFTNPVPWVWVLLVFFVVCLPLVGVVVYCKLRARRRKESLHAEAIGNSSAEEMREEEERCPTIATSPEEHPGSTPANSPNGGAMMMDEDSLI